MQAIILAAGMGKRLKHLTQDCTKCMVKVNGVTLIERLLSQLDNLSLNRIVIVLGYKKEELSKYIDSLNIKTKIEFVNNDVYDTTNNIYSLYLAGDKMAEDDTLLFESDVIIEENVLKDLKEDKRDNVALVDLWEPWMDGTCVKLNNNQEIVGFISKSEFDYNECGKYYKTVNIYKFSKDFSKECYLPFLEAYQKALGYNEYYEQVLRVLTTLDNVSVVGKNIKGSKWYEIDDEQDLHIAETIFAEDKDKYSKLSKQYGGYWRYSNVLDYCYLVHPYFPTQKMSDEIKNMFIPLLTQYPSGAEVLSLTAAKTFGLLKEQVVVGNGAAELIKALMDMQNGKVGIVRPTFEEYPNRYSNEELVVYNADENNNFKYNSKDLINYFSDKEISLLILINPDNPTGNYLNCNEVIELLDWSKTNNITIVVDESFADFASELNNSLLRNSYLDEYPNLIVMKSLSKSYGIPGIRLGILASGNKELVKMIKKEVAIWNINSFGEFFLQILEKYKNDYQKSLVLFRIERERLKEALGKIKGFTVIHSEANYFMVKLSDGLDSTILANQLISKYNIFIKDLSAKMGNKTYIRLAVRGKEDNDLLIKALMELLNNN